MSAPTPDPTPLGAREQRLETFAETVIALTKPLTEDPGAAEFIQDVRVRTTLHSLAVLALHGSGEARWVSSTEEPTTERPAQ